MAGVVLSAGGGLSRFGWGWDGGDGVGLFGFLEAALDEAGDDLGVGADEEGHVRVGGGFADADAAGGVFHVHVDQVSVLEDGAEEGVPAAEGAALLDAGFHGVDVLADPLGDLRVVRLGEGLDAAGDFGDFAADVFVASEQGVKDVLIGAEGGVLRAAGGGRCGRARVRACGGGGGEDHEGEGGREEGHHGFTWLILESM